MRLRQKTLSGVKWTSISAVVTTIIQLAQVSILTRFLLPSDFGLMAIVMVVIGFSQAFLDMGISNAIIYKQEITGQQLSTLYWMNVITGVLLFLIIAAISPFIASFYSEPRISHLLILVGLTFLIQPFGQQFLVLLQKELRFKEAGIIDISSKTASLIVSTWFAVLHYGVLALVYGTLAAVAVQSLMLVSQGLREHKPHLVFHVSEVREFIGFGMYQMGERIVNYFNSQIDVLLVGKLLGSSPLGVYSVAKQLVLKPSLIVNPVVTKVAFPALSKVQQDTSMLKAVYLKTVNYLSSTNFPIYALIVVLSPQIVHILFGQRWAAAIPILEILSIFGAIRSTMNPVGSLLLAKGRAKLAFYWNLGLLLFVPGAIALTCQFGLVAVSWGMVAVMTSLIVPSWFFLVKSTSGAGLWEYLKQIVTPLFISVIIASVSYFSCGLTQNLTGKFITAGVAALATMALLNYVFNREYVVALLEMVGLQRSRSVGGILS